MNTPLSESGPTSIAARRLTPPPQPREKTPWLIGFFCLLVPALPAISVFPGPLRSNGSPARIVAILFFALALLGFVLVSRSGETRTVNPGAVLIGVYFLIQLLVYGVGIMHSGNAVLEASKTRAVLSLVANVGIVLYILKTVKTARQRSIVLGVLVTGLTFACVVGLLQSLTAIDLRFLFQPPGFVLNTEAAGLAGRNGALRVVGTSDHAIEFSVLAAAAVPLALHLARYAVKPLHRQLSTVACLIALIAVPAAVSRSGVTSLVAALLVYMFAMSLRQLGYAVLIGLGVLAGYRAAFSSSWNALWATIVNSEEDVSITSRVGDYAAVSKTFHEHPWFGLGLGGSPPTEYRFLDNEWLQSTVQGGALGLAAMVLLTVSGIAGIVAGLRCARSPRERDQVYAIGAAFVGVLASSTAFDLFSFQQAAFMYFILFGLLWSTYYPSGLRRRPSSHRNRFTTPLPASNAVCINDDSVSTSSRSV
ncbi:O-antigen ligase family protein [Rhodococcus sp. NPDC127528]|uniref:O-antigen ligase family protein n=1 Tax=unclassified Rhodococcus (in: high G+C Gram-positive bacteria) TaxID=192944 RepID=UPI0036445ABC